VLRRRSLGLILAIAALVAMAASVSVAAPSQAAEMATTDANVVAEVGPGDPAVATELAVEQALLDDTNADRATNGLPTLDFDAETLGIARARAVAQLDLDNLSHYDADGQLAFVHLLADAHLSYQLAGENLARSSVDDAGVVDRVEQALMQSPTHRKNILEPSFARVAIGAATDAHGRIAFAEIFRSAL
jgi:uncharacterized protein YkwD